MHSSLVIPPIGGALVVHSSFESPRVLYLTHRVPYPPDKGDRIRTYHLLRLLARRARVWLGCLADEPVTEDARAVISDLCERVAAIPIGRSRWLNAGWSFLKGKSLSEGLFASEKLARVVREWLVSYQFDAAVASSSALVPYLLEPGLAGKPVIVDLIDVDSQKWLDFASISSVPKKWLYRLEAKRVRKIERSLPPWTRAVCVVSRAEADIYDSFTHTGTATVATNGVDLEYFAPRDDADCSPHAEREVASAASDERPITRSVMSTIFIGALDYLPNVDAAMWFARDIWPAIREKFPIAEFHIIGRNPTRAVKELSALPGVKAVGQVPDVRPYLASASVVVVPLRLARGVQNKVLEAMAMAKPVVATPEALRALQTEPGVHLLAASTVSEWVDSVCGLLADPVKRTRLGIAARQFVEQHHNWDRCLQPLLDKLFQPSN
ncbi:MAG: TIGR03087 family PEP-CTERM/XrtA system glycosyltransferase [Planctomycetia bacterium]|nr:TIGR03087 family PEP-CTERM/XrtA system glycosyltransferase [Planctomycetia bacterium]